jgi:hypothetical protein
VQYVPTFQSASQHSKEDGVAVQYVPTFQSASQPSKEDGVAVQYVPNVPRRSVAGSRFVSHPSNGDAVVAGLCEL